jgi:hypothetical protein
MVEVQARRTLDARRLRLSVLAPFGAWLGCGTLRVLRLRANSDETVDVVAGYDSYERIPGDVPASAGSAESR